MDPISLATAIIVIAKGVKSQADTAVSNRDFCRQLSRRCQDLIPSLERLKSDIQTNAEAYRKALSRLLDIVKDCRNFIELYGNSSTVYNFLKANTINSSFQELNGQLNSAVHDLQLGLSIDSRAQNQELERLMVSSFDQIKSTLASLAELYNLNLNIQDIALQNFQVQFLERNTSMVMKYIQEGYNQLQAAVQPESPRASSKPVTSLDSIDQVAEADCLRGEQIGEGSFGYVYKCTYRGVDMALKEFNKCLNKDGRPVNLSDAEVRQILKEARILKFCHHPNVLTFVAATVTKEKAIMITELATSSLDKVIYEDNTLDYNQKLAYMYDVAKGLKYLHFHGIIHKDLKPANILICHKEDEDGYIAKIADFGVSSAVGMTTRRTGVKVERVGTCAYEAPEVLDEAEYYSASDIYAFGITMNEILTCQIPWENCKSDDQIVRLVKDGRRPKPYIPYLPHEQQAVDIIGSSTSGCLAQEHTQRPSAAILCKQFKQLLPRTSISFTSTTPTVKVSHVAIKLPECPICLKEYNSTRECYTICRNGHSICSICKVNPNRQSKCPLCHEPEDRNGGVINRDIMQLIEAYQQLQQNTTSTTTDNNQSSYSSSIEPVSNTVSKTNTVAVVTSSSLSRLSLNSSTTTVPPTNVFSKPVTMPSINTSAQDINLPVAPEFRFNDLYLWCRNGDLSSIQQLFSRYNCTTLINTCNEQRMELWGKGTPLHIACYQGHTEVVKLLVESGAEVNIENNNGSTALMYASRWGHIEVVKLLLVRGAEVNIQNKDGDTALKYASDKGHIEVIKLLLEKGAEVNIQTNMRWTALMSVSREGHMEVVKLLLDKGADINIQDKDGWIALTWASYKGHIEVIELLLEKGAEVNIQDKVGWTALMLASDRGHMEVVKLLLEKGAQVNIHNIDGNTALMWASNRGHLEIVMLLLEKGAEVNIQDKIGDTALIDASRYGYIGVVTLLVEKGAEVNIQNKDGWTALMAASDRGYIEVVELLLEKGAEVNIQNKYGDTALMNASIYGYIEVVKLLLDKGADVNIQNKDGWTALMNASQEGDIEVVELLLEKGAEVNIQNKDGDTALMNACLKGHMEVIKILLEKGADINIQNKDGWRALMSASGGGWTALSGRRHGEVVKLLLEKGADINIQDKYGDTALMIASGRRHGEVVKLLLENGAEVNIQNKYGATALMSASDNGDVEIVRLLLEKGTNMNIQDKEYGSTALMKASTHTHVEVIKLLLEKGAEVNIKNKDGWTALMYASDKGRINVVKLLLEKGAEVNNQNNDGETVLMRASKRGHIEVIKLLLEKGAELNIQDKNRVTALMSASQEGHVEVVRLPSGSDMNILDKNRDTASTSANKHEIGRLSRENRATEGCCCLS